MNKLFLRTNPASKIFILAFVFLLSQSLVHAQEKKPTIDVLHYQFSLVLNDNDDTISGEALISIVFLQQVSSFDLDLVKKNPTGKGMQVSGITLNDQAVTFTHEADQLHISSNAKTGDTLQYKIQYEGIPADGLIIDKNKYGHRSFFGDNWPNRAHNWLPCVDNPADKASVDFIVTAPEHYQVVANGLQVEENNLPNHLKQTHWKETVDLPTKVMVIGAADFAVNYAGDVNCIPVYSWVYPEDKDKGFYDYALAKDILPFFIQKVGPYAYRKLANVQSKTKFGGMENASAIFYFENSIKGDRKVEALLTHEIAHQWFGNSATEKSWPHVWLSEGFATYMTHLYFENKYGLDTLQKRLDEDRAAVIEFSKKRNTPVVDTSVSKDFLQLLNANSYQKGGWVLHMLRRKLGDTLFWRGIRNYYNLYAGKNANTDDFRKVMENASGQNLKSFFQQWLFTPGQPVIRTSWKYDAKKKTAIITIEQIQEKLFSFPLELLIKTGSSESVKKIDIAKKLTTFIIPAQNDRIHVIADPNYNVLFQEASKNN